MSRHQYWLKNEQQWITLADEPFAGGGEGNLFRVMAPREWRGYVAKLYHPHKCTEERERKTNYLLHYPPEIQGENADGHPSVIWVRDALYQNDAFKGFLMPYTQGEKLEILTTPKIPRKFRARWERFDAKKSPDALRLRQLLGFNICIAIQQIHALGRYVLVDMKPDNIVVQPNGLVSIVDTDSVEVVEQGQTLFEAPVATPEYTPPEHYQTLNYDPTQRQAWDRFGLAVILYKLFFGIHPFAASAGPPYEGLTTLQDKIEHGLFVHAPQHQGKFAVVPPPHRQFSNLDPSLQALFLRCFVDGHTDPEARPTAEEWCAAILLATKDEALYERYRHVLSGEVIRQQNRHFPLPSHRLVAPQLSPQAKPLLELTKPMEWSVPTTGPDLQPEDYIRFTADAVRNRRDLFILGMLSIMFIVTGVGSFFVPLMWGIFGLQLHKAYQKSRPYREKRRNERKLESAKKAAKKRDKAVAKQQKRLDRTMSKVGKNIRKVVEQIEQEREALKTYLEQQDQAVQALNQRIADNYQHLQQNYLQEAQSNRAIARVEADQYQSLAQLKAAITEQNQEAVYQLKRQKITESEGAAYQQERIAIERFLHEQQETIHQDLAQRLNQVQLQEEEAIRKLWHGYHQRAKLLPNLPRLWQGIRISRPITQRIRRFFKQLGIPSLQDILEVDVQGQFFRLRDGQIIRWNNMPQSRKMLRNMAQWLDELKHQAISLYTQEDDIKVQFDKVRQATQDSQRMALDGLEQVQEKRLQKVILGLPNDQLGAPYEQLQQQYEQTMGYVEELEVAFAQAEEEILPQYEAEYEVLMAASQARVEESQARLIALEAKIEGQAQRLKRSKAYEQYQRLQREVQVAREALAKVNAYTKRVEQYRHINFRAYLNTILKTKF